MLEDVKLLQKNNCILSVKLKKKRNVRFSIWANRTELGLVYYPVFFNKVIILNVK